jgi:hypothetical protein
LSSPFWPFLSRLSHAELCEWWRESRIHPQEEHVRDWLNDCSRGDEEVHWKKPFFPFAVGVQCMWKLAKMELFHPMALM